MDELRRIRLKVAVSATEGSLDAIIDPRFGRCLYYIIIDMDTMAFEAVSNTSLGSPSGAGIRAAQIVVGRGVEAVLTGTVGPNAMEVLSSSGINIYTGAKGSVRQAVEAFKRGELKAYSTAGYGGFYGGRGGGGMGIERGMGLYPIPQKPAEVEQSDRAREKDALKKKLKQLEDQLKEVKKKLEELR